MCDKVQRCAAALWEQEATDVDEFALKFERIPLCSTPTPPQDMCEKVQRNAQFLAEDVAEGEAALAA